MTLSGFGVARDTQAAVKFFTTAAEQGLAEAQFMLGALYSRGVVGAPGDIGDGKEKESANGQGASKTTPPPETRPRQGVLQLQPRREPRPRSCDVQLGDDAAEWKPGVTHDV